MNPYNKLILELYKEYLTTDNYEVIKRILNLYPTINEFKEYADAIIRNRQ